MPPAIDGDRLVIWALGTFHAASLITVAALLLHLTGGLTSTLTSLSTVSGLALFGALWLTTVWFTHRAFSGVLGTRLRPTLSGGELAARAVWRGGLNGVAFLAFLAAILGIPAVLHGGLVIVLGLALVFATVGVAIAFVVGCVLGLLFAGIDLLLVSAARALIP